MSVKHAEGNRPTPRRSWSLVSRLVTGYSIASSLLLLVSLGILYAVVIRHIDEEDSRFLIDKLHVVRAVLAEDSVSLDSILAHDLPTGAAEYSIHVVDVKSGDLLFENSADLDFPSSAAFPEPLPVGTLPESATGYDAPDGRQYLLVSALAESGSRPAWPVRIQIAQNRSDDTAFTRKLRNFLIAVLLSGIVATIAISWLTTRRGLRPLGAMREEVAGIGASQLHQRLSAGPWPTELISLVSAFDEMLSRLEESFQRLSRFSADLAHELRTPIQNLRGEAEVALTRQRSAEDYREVIESSIEECERMAGLVDSLLFLARAENDEMRIDRHLVDLAKEIDKIVDFYEVAADEMEIGVSRVGEGSLEADPLLLGRAISNLVSNALAYSRTGGKITIAVTEENEIAVNDSGIGIAPEHLDRIFDRFYRVDSSRAPEPAGTGLGLAIVKSIMELHDGSVTIKSEPDRGTTVTLRFSKLSAGASSPRQ